MRFVLMAVPIFLLWGAGPAMAFHDRLSPAEQQSLNQYYVRLDNACYDGNRQACRQHKSLDRFMDKLAWDAEECNWGNSDACADFNKAFVTLQARFKAAPRRTAYGD